MGQCLGTPASQNHSTRTQNGTFCDQNNIASTDDQQQSVILTQVLNLKVFTYSEIKACVSKHGPITGKGDLGKVYKAWLDEETLAPVKPGTGITVAIKWLESDITRGTTDWQTEVDFLGKISHPNLVKLFGYCCEDKTVFLVYEFMQKGSLENHLFKGIGDVPIPWKTRLQIAIDVAQGLAFLHASDNNVIHRDIKPSNILLDGNFNAKISNLTLAVYGPTGDDSPISTTVMGTYGYAAPEYIATGHLNSKCDVYSFGVVLLEILTGLRSIDQERPKDQQDLVNWARPYLRSKTKPRKIMDVKMNGQYSSKMAFQAAQIALKCLDLHPKSRPSMKEVLVELKRIKEMSKNPKEQ